MKRLNLEAESSPGGLWGKPGACLGDMQADLILSGKPQATPIPSVSSASVLTPFSRIPKNLSRRETALSALIN